MAKERTCIKCKQTKPIHQFARTKSPYMPGGRSIICIPCLSHMVAQDNLEEVDRLCRYLDVPFDVNEWTKLFGIHGSENTLAAYFELLTDDRYDGMNWAIENERWRIAREDGTLDEEIEVLSKSELKRLKGKWGDFYTARELKFLEEYYNQICSTQNVTTPILREYACDLCELEIQIKKGVRSGEDVKKLMDARDNIIKMAHFEANNSKNAADFDSTGEVITYLVRKGWHPEWKTEPKDSIDFLMKNVQSYLNRLVTNEGNFVEQVEDKKQKFDVTERLDSEEEEIDVEPMDIEYEGEEELMLEIGDD